MGTFAGRDQGVASSPDRRPEGPEGATVTHGEAAPIPSHVPAVSALGEETTDLVRPALFEDSNAETYNTNPAGSGPTPPPSIPGYEILGDLGRGGMGVVYKARQVGLNRLVALKMILAGERLGASQVSRFRAEAEAVARLQHPNIVQIFEVGEHHGRPYFSLEFVEGGSLADHLDGTPWPPTRAAELVGVLARAVHAAHRRGVVHRDLKPANVLQTPDGVPKITDFGLAKRLDVEEGLTQSGAVLGSPSYMAPEQAGHEPGAIGPPTDIYALGAILYELLTGRPPFKASTPMATVAQVIHDDPVPPIQLQSRTPVDLDTICLKCLEKNPKRRYATAQELADELGRWLRGEPISARPTPIPELAVKWARRHSTVAALIAAVVLITVLGFAGVLWQWHRARVNAEYARLKEKEARTAATQLGQANNDLRTALDRARRHVYATLLNLARREYDDTNLSRVLEILAAQRPARKSDGDLRGFEWYYLNRLCHADLMTLAGHHHDVQCVAYSPDGRKLASGSFDRTVKVWDAGTGRELNTLEGHADIIYGVAFGPGGRRLASAGRDRTVIVWDVAAGRPRHTLRGHAGVVLGVAFDRDGRLLASAGDDGLVKIWDAETGRELRALRGHTGEVLGVAFSPDGRRLASAGQDQTVRVWDTETGRELRSIVAHASLARAVAYGPDGRRLASLGGDGVKVWDTETGELVVSLSDRAYGPWGVAFSPDGRLLASANSDQTVRVWDAETGREVRVLKGHQGVVNSVAFSPDSRRLASASRDRTVKVWDPTSDPTALAIKADPVNVMAVAFSPSGDQLATANVDGTVWIWEAETGREALSLKGHTGMALHVAFSPDGRSLASAGADGLVKVWDATSGEEVVTLRGHDARVNRVAFSPDSRLLASASVDKTVKVWDLASGRDLRTLGHGNYQATAVAFSADGRLLASGWADGSVTFWHPTDGREEATWRAHSDSVYSLAFSPDGRFLASAGCDRVGRVWEVESRRERAVLRGHSFVLTDIHFSPDGRRVVSSGDVTVRLWDPVTGQEVLIFKDLKNMARGVSFSPDGRRLAAAGGDGTVMVWDAREPAAGAR